jgi:hypothetical protein
MGQGAARPLKIESYGAAAALAPLWKVEGLERTLDFRWPVPTPRQFAKM